MNRAACLIRELAGAGVVIARHGDQLVIDGPEAEIELHWDQLVAEKPNLIRLLEDGIRVDPDWQRFFDARTSALERERGMRRLDAELSAFMEAVERWLMLNPPNASSEDVCQHCGQYISEEHSLDVAIAGSPHSRLHPVCASVWQRKRRLEAIGAVRKQICWPRSAR